GRRLLPIDRGDLGRDSRGWKWDRLDVAVEIGTAAARLADEDRMSAALEIRDEVLGRGKRRPRDEDDDPLRLRDARERTEQVGVRVVAAAAVVAEVADHAPQPLLLRRLEHPAREAPRAARHLVVPDVEHAA